MNRIAAAAAAFYLAGSGMCFAQETQPQASEPAASSQALYDGWRARQLLGSAVLNKQDRRTIGHVRDIIVDKDGRIAAVVVEGGGPVQLPEAIYRIPWSEIDQTRNEPGIVADLSNGQRPRYGSVPGVEGAPTLPREFRITEVIGDYARLQTGYGFGYVVDTIFTDDGRVAAVLVSRDTGSGTRALAFPFPAVQSRWDPGANYFGLPHVTPEEAEKSAVPLDVARLSDNPL